jgi:hypothetical protein
MRKTNVTLASLMAVASLAVLGSCMPAPRKRGGNRDYTPYKPPRYTDQDREIAAHNSKVEQRKAEKKARKAQGASK